MGILYAISILAFAALLWAALSIARHIRHSQPADEPIAPPAPKPALGNRPFLEPRPVAAPRIPRPFEFFDPREFQAHPTQHRPTPPAQQISTQQISSQDFKAPDFMTQELETHDLPIHGVRRPPRPAPTPRVSDRIDWAYFNKDLGDLNDPEPSNHARTNPRTNIRQA